MTELFLAYLWQFQYFDKQNLQTTAQEAINILQIGIQNTDAGADFQEAKIEIGNKLWHGSVEIHLKDTDWQAHKHSQNKQYNNVILHVVWEKLSTENMQRQDGSMIPTLELKNRVSALLIEKYQDFRNPKDTIPCESYWKSIDRLKILSMLDNVLVQRLQRKAQNILDRLAENTGDWEETSYQILAQSFGFKVNQEAFLALAKSLPFKIISKHSTELQDIEALIFGQSGLLENPTSTENSENPAHQQQYATTLLKNYAYLQHKYNLSPIEKERWKYLRLRPANFPMIRLAQFVSLIFEQKLFFTNFMQAETAKKLQTLLSVKASPYWYAQNNNAKTGTEKTGTEKIGNLGKESANNLIINTIIPLWTAYSMHKDTDMYMDKAIKILEELPAEHNKITELWDNIGLKIQNAFDAQASIELYNEFCSKKQCLQCRIGNAILHS